MKIKKYFFSKDIINIKISNLELNSVILLDLLSKFRFENIGMLINDVPIDSKIFNVPNNNFKYMDIRHKKKSYDILCQINSIYLQKFLQRCFNDEINDFLLFNIKDLNSWETLLKNFTRLSQVSIIKYGISEFTIGVMGYEGIIDILMLKNIARKIMLNNLDNIKIKDSKK